MLLARTPIADPLNSLADTALLRTSAYVGGAWVHARDDASFDVRNPYDGAAVAKVAALGGDEARQAVDAASDALPAWKAMLPQDRALILRRWHDLILEAREDLALIMTMEQGKPLAESLGEIGYGASFIEWFAEEAKRMNVETVTSHLDGAHMALSREPLGVAALFTPWNFPSAMLARKAGAALAAGCTVVAHVASHAPLSALALAELAERAGVPAGVFNVLTGDPAEIGEVFTSDRRVRVVSFTGSTEIGRKIAVQCAPTLKRLLLELGGHAPFIVFDDADIEKAVDVAIAAKFATSGQDCLAVNRIYVQRGVYDAFCTAFAERVEALKVGNGMDPVNEIGPMMHQGAVDKARAHVEDALAKGARLIAEADVDDGQLMVAPVALADVPDDALIMREETFAPVAPIAMFDTEAEVVARANDSEYGLVAYVLTENAGRALRLPKMLEYGMVAVNRAKLTGAPIPFGGIKQSGMGREGSRHGLEAFTDLKYVCLDVN
ncbi:NAD-dependent succinate-semialdehyde dehydrogenase [Pelagovum pacificum]|uniref:NAD-dependent succinate-semialdehyde dehydrogenase n=1 Tax=Pelagovum pacificum TaxID=2588711 RepID=A0A5C5G994_9RHOB|nr:NAD-dependent succinate-semialdehyde dehydrogenase [Pelagovum pacificum]TNY31306.1 NAD-dependent succinate-semialdehyde dehydrogenase [Pelagovum pacificum]